MRVRGTPLAVTGRAATGSGPDPTVFFPAEPDGSLAWSTVTSKSYGDDFYADQRPGSRASAEVVVPILLAQFNPTSVLDVGCGVGTWLSVFHEAGVRVRGVDGDYATSRPDVAVPSDMLFAADLTRPLDLSERFDMVMSLEVAEHLPDDGADGFVDSLVRHGDIVVFSAAIPHQGGVGHINEQWPSYWVEKFQRRGFAAMDSVRPLIWDENQVEPWYRQNLLVFARAAGDAIRPRMIDVVHPALWDPSWVRDWSPQARAGGLTLRRLAQELPNATREAVRHRLRKR